MLAADPGPLLLMPQQAGDVDQGLEVYEKAATAQEKIGSSWHAAKHMESAAELAKQHKRWEKVMECYKTAAEFYITAGKATAGRLRLERTEHLAHCRPAPQA